MNRHIKLGCNERRKRRSELKAKIPEIKRVLSND